MGTISIQFHYIKICKMLSLFSCWLSILLIAVGNISQICQGNDDQIIQNSEEEKEIGQLINKLDTDEWANHPKEFVNSLARKECRLLKGEEIGKNELEREIIEEVKHRYCRRGYNRERTEEKTEEIVAKISAIFQENGQKTVEKLRKMEENASKLERDQILARKWLALIEAKMEPSEERDAVARVLRNKRIGARNLFELGLELWALATSEVVAVSGSMTPQLVPAAMAIRVHHRRRRRMPAADWSAPPLEDWAKELIPPPPGPADPRKVWQRRGILLTFAMIVSFVLAHVALISCDILCGLVKRWLVCGALWLVLFNFLDKHTPTILLPYI